MTANSFSASLVTPANFPCAAAGILDGSGCGGLDYLQPDEPAHVRNGGDSSEPSRIRDLSLGWLRRRKPPSLLCVALSRLREGLDGPASPLRPREYKKVQEICDLFRRDPRCEFTIAELARRVMWNESRMMACFKEITGETILGYRQRLRLERALNQLRATNTPITQVAADAGYSHPANFATAFKRRFGYTPRDARVADLIGTPLASKKRLSCWM